MFWAATRQFAGTLACTVKVGRVGFAVTALQAGYQFQGNLPWFVVDTLVTQSIILELGPVLTGLILAGRIGALRARCRPAPWRDPRPLARARP